MTLKKEESPARLVPHRKFPPYRFIQGKNIIHPNKEGGYRFNDEEPFIDSKEVKNFSKNEDFLFAIDLFNHKFYWEAHVWLEAFWHASEKKSSHRDFFKAMILMCAAAIKNQLERYSVSEKQFVKAKDIFKTISPIFPLNAEAICNLIDCYVKSRKHQYIDLKEILIYN